MIFFIILGVAIAWCLIYCGYLRAQEITLQRKQAARGTEGDTG